jgi:hypothetical protein
MKCIELDDAAQQDDAPTKTRTFANHDSDEPTAVAARGEIASCLAEGDEECEEFGLARTSVMEKKLLEELAERTRDEGIPDSPLPPPTAEPPGANDAAASRPAGAGPPKSAVAAPHPASMQSQASAHGAGREMTRNRRIAILTAALLTTSLAVIGQHALHRRSQSLAALPAKPPNLVMVTPGGLVPLSSTSMAAAAPAPKTTAAAADVKANDMPAALPARVAGNAPTSPKRTARRR